MPLKAPISLLLALLLSGGSMAATYTYTYTDNCARAYEHFMSLHLAEGRQAIALERKANPNNLMAVYLADYEDCILLLINCDIDEYRRRAAAMDERLKLLANGDPASPWYRFCYAGMHLHRAIINIRFGEQYKAAFNFRKSYALLKENQRLYPDLEYNNIIAGLLEAVVGSLPGSYKWLASVFGMKGSVQKGTEKLGAFLSTHNSSHPLYAETNLYYLYTRFYLLAEHAQVWQILNDPAFKTKNNLLNTFVKANIALDHRHADDALALLRTAATEPGYSSYPVFDHQYGYALLTHCDTACAFYFSRYLRNNKSDVYIKDAWQKMALAWYVNGRTDKAEYCRKMAGREGTARIDGDKQAARFATSGVWPHRALLQARLLIEGGYYEKALGILQGIDKDRLQHPADRAEYHFRLGRVYEEMAATPGKGQYFKQALAQFREAMTEGKDRHEQFAARAALHTGRIYEQLNMNTEAIAMYNECLNMPDHDFQNSIDQQAKSGINRIEHRQAGQ
ncbi:hypothetical protein GCM10023093_18070 [Nemorincola caseinilytica]|uniref:Tetratricopeptide repeat protein n=1 Tax=Nemorincola caseinilytica TaxID=2054315 RepID=A0ABP8NDN3_9BACT